jgi:hypothetical protein
VVAKGTAMSWFNRELRGLKGWFKNLNKRLNEVEVLIQERRFLELLKRMWPEIVIFLFSGQYLPRTGT